MRHTRILIPGLMLTASGCTVGPNFSPPVAMAPAAATAAAAQTMLSDKGESSASWWHSFGDPVLDELEQRALAGNLNLAEATARIGRARAEVRIAGAAGLPRAGAAASYQRERASPEGILSLTGEGPPSPSAAGGADPFGTASVPPSSKSDDYDLFQAGFDASWELDLWGKARRLREAAHADAQGAVLDRDAARISLSAEVARTYMRLRGAEARLAVLGDNRKAVAAGQHIAERRLNSGAATRYDAATAGTQLAAIDAQLPLAEREAAEARNALAFLTGAEPHALDALLAGGSVPMEISASTVPAALPSDLARQRPDIQAAEAALHAATARIGVARADFYPSISLSGSLGLQSVSLDNFPLWNARQFVLGPILSLPIFQGGRLTGRLELAKADQQVAALRYRATVLKAWHEIDDALEALRTADARLAATRAGVDQSRIAAHVSERRYGAGATGYIDVLVAERARLDREGEWIDARTERAVAVTALYKALGGGWTPSAA
ncbi:efflux transporter outer membrane subunit [Sphingomonas sp. QA11]|uniref:efflux transporter outer membrane subunit n=1 Tax=Sphingomonas sp. QA11 TaxID=2950605 RepID=UPI002349B46B|nr:efflux transporter outer membrane subunit [Sphingomonas sp. QA11]WCM25983.1 efflux transporter outer membrane subunit [Sphingomonas sp. QA11]